MIHLKQALAIIILVFSYSTSFSQNEKKYRSNEEDAYYKSLNEKWEHKDFVPVSIETATKIPCDYIKLVTLKNPSIYNHQQVFSIYWDSIMQSQKDIKNNIEKFDSLMLAMYNDKIGGIPKMSILKEEKLGNKWAIIYTDSKYDDFIYGGFGYWIALSNDKGETWKQYYTGLTENCYYFFKPNSKIPLWKDSVTLQIECAIVRQISEVIHPLPAKYELVQDSIAVQLDINKIIQDSDNDGLTDIVENKLLLDPNNPDTDGDGIKDSEDKNPRFKSIKSEKALIYETLIENFHPNKRGQMEIDVNNPPVFEKIIADSLNINFESLSLLVTDDTDLQGLTLHDQTIIIMSSKEYESYKLKYPSHLMENSFSKMFRCNRRKNMFKINHSFFTGGSTYIIKKTKKGWKIFMLSSWIS